MQVVEVVSYILPIGIGLSKLIHLFLSPYHDIEISCRPEGKANPLFKLVRERKQGLSRRRRDESMDSGGLRSDMML
jgi:hypothetical protein